MKIAMFKVVIAIFNLVIAYRQKENRNTTIVQIYNKYNTLKKPNKFGFFFNIERRM